MHFVMSYKLDSCNPDCTEIRCHLLPSGIEKGRFMAFHDACATSSVHRPLEQVPFKQAILSGGEYY